VLRPAPPAALDVYADLTGLDDDRRARVPVIKLRGRACPAADWPGVHFPAFPNTATSFRSASATVLPPPCHTTLTALLLARD